MRHDSDFAYFRDRAEDELERAREAVDPVAGRAHFMLAGLYFDRAFRGTDDQAPVSAELRSQIVTTCV